MREEPTNHSAMRLVKPIASGIGTVVLLCALTLSTAAQVISKPQVYAPPPEVPSLTDFVRFHDGEQLFLNVRRTAYDRVELQTPGSNEWQTVGYEQFPEGERQRLKRSLMVEEELSPPEVTGVRVTLRGGETMEGFLKKDDPEEWPEKEDKNTSNKGNTQDGLLQSSTEENQKDTQFILLTRNGQQRRLTYDSVVEKDLIQVNPLEMVGSEQLYQIEKAKRDLNSARGHWELGKLALNLHQFERATSHFQKAVELNPSYQPAVNLRLSIIEGWRTRFGTSSEQNDNTPTSKSAGSTSPSSSGDSNQDNPFSGTGN